MQVQLQKTYTFCEDTIMGVELEEEAVKVNIKKIMRGRR